MRDIRSDYEQAGWIVRRNGELGVGHIQNELFATEPEDLLDSGEKDSHNQ